MPKGVRGKRPKGKKTKVVRGKVQREQGQDLVGNSLSEEEAEIVASCWEQACRARREEKVGGRIVNCWATLKIWQRRAAGRERWRGNEPQLRRSSRGQQRLLVYFVEKLQTFDTYGNFLVWSWAILLRMSRINVYWVDWHHWFPNLQANHGEWAEWNNLKMKERRLC